MMSTASSIEDSNKPASPQNTYVQHQHTTKATVSGAGAAHTQQQQQQHHQQHQYHHYQQSSSNNTKRASVSSSSSKSSAAVVVSSVSSSNKMNNNNNNNNNSNNTNKKQTAIATHALLTPSTSTSTSSSWALVTPSASTSASVHQNYQQLHQQQPQQQQQQHHQHQHQQKSQQQQHQPKQQTQHQNATSRPLTSSTSSSSSSSVLPCNASVIQAISIKRHAADVSICSTSSLSCCSSSGSASVTGTTSSNAVVVTPVITQKLSRTIPSDKINLRLILVSGKTKEFLFNPSDSAGDIARTVFDNWPEDWEREIVSKAEILRLIYQGRFLHCNVTLGALGLPLGKTTVMHLVPRDNLPEPNSQDQRQKSKGGSGRCCSTNCCIL